MKLFILIFLQMINPTILSTRLAGLVGFRQSYNPAYALLDAANQKSRSGYFINDNAFVKIETIKDSQDYEAISNEDFNSYLRGKISTSVIDVANAVFNENDFIDRQLIYKNAINKVSQTVTINNDKNAEGNYVNTYDLPVGFQGYWIQPSKDKNIAFKIQRVLLEFNGVGPLTLYLYNTADVTKPIQQKTIQVTGPFQEEILDWICDNSTSGAGYKGDYYLGYFSKDMTLKPFKREYRESVILSEISEITYYRAGFQNFTEPSQPFDLMGYSPYVYYNGINPDITVYEDFTDLIIQNEKLFARAIMLNTQIGFLSETVASIRSNRNQRVASMDVGRMMTEIEGETGEGNIKVKGLRPQFFGALSQIKKELDKLRIGYEQQGQITVNTIS